MNEGRADIVAQQLVMSTSHLGGNSSHNCFTSDPVLDGAPQKVAENGSDIWALAFHMKDTDEAPGLGLTQPQQLQPFGK